MWQVIGALFVSLGVSTVDIVVGLALGNLLAVLTWDCITAPIAVQPRLTLYAYLEKIAGRHMISIYSVVNAVLFSVVAGATVSVSVSAVRIPFNIQPQATWYPSSVSFVLVVAVICKQILGLHRFFLLVPTWLAAMLLYILIATPMGAKRPFTEQVTKEFASYQERRDHEWQFLRLADGAINVLHQREAGDQLLQVSRLIAFAALVACLGLGVWT